MRTTVELFTRSYDAELSVSNDGVHLSLKSEEIENLDEYLRMVLPSYVKLPEGELTLEQLLQIANQWQQANPELKLSEPLTKLPYDVDVEVKAMLEEISRITGESQAQLLIKIVNKGYQKVKGNQ